jgi:O-antigen/teichoic acid export membrane protein
MTTDTRGDCEAAVGRDTGSMEAKEILEQDATDSKQQGIRISPATLLADGPQGGLREQSVRGGATVVASQAVLQCLSIGSSMVLARLLVPSDFGLLAMVTAVTGFAAIFRDMGLSMSTIQRETITQAQVSTLFWINVAVGCGLTLVLAVAAPLVTRFYGRPELLAITLAIAPTFVFSSLGIQHGALLRRQMRFTTLASVQIISTVISVVTAIALALMGLRYWALVAQTLVASLAGAAGMWIASGWRPGLPSRRVGTRGMLGFGANITAFDVVNYFSRNLDNILIGRLHGSLALGYYSKAYGLLMLPISNIRGPITTVALPALSRLVSSPERYRAYYLEMLSIIAFVSMPLVTLLFVCSEGLIRLVLGAKWGAASPLFQLLAITAFIQPAASTWGVVLLSSGQGTRYFRWGAFNAAATSLAFLIGVRWGAAGVAIAYAIINYLLLYPSFWYCFQDTPIKPRDFFVGIWRPAVASLLMGLVLYWGYSCLATWPAIAAVLTCCLASVALYLIIWMLLPGGMSALRWYLPYVALVFRGAKQTVTT